MLSGGVRAGCMVAQLCLHAFRYGTLSSSGTGKGVNVYVVDSGVRLTHQEFVSDLTGQRRATFG